MHSVEITSWRLAGRVFGRLIGRTEDWRRRFLARLRLDSDTRARISDLCAACERVDAVLDRPVEEHLRAMADETRAGNALAGRRLGVWELQEEIGAGGMAVVYRAKRVDGVFEQDAAVKLLSLAAIGRYGLQTFERERQLLSQLHHPNIAAILDGGVAGDGTPYLVMELIEGERLDRFASGLETRAIVRLMHEVCLAVAWAHRHLVVHRDLKPSNILIDRFGRAKLLDFGIAKLLDPEARDQGTVTRVMTPEFAAPEQRAGEAITTATDVYALGQILHKLVGQRSLRDDLGRIIAMARNEAPEKRYGNAADLADDLAAWLAQRPVRARGASLAYRLAKFVRRNRLAATAGVAVAVLVIAFAISSAMQYRATVTERDRAHVEADKANQVKEFALSLFEASDPWKTADPDISVRDLLDRGRERIESIADQPAVQAEMLATISGAYTNLGELEPATEAAERALALFRANPDGPDRALAKSLQQLGRISYQRGDYATANDFFSEALAVLGGEDGSTRAEVLVELSQVLRNQGSYEEAEPLLNEAIGWYEASYGKNAPEAFLALSELANTRSDQGDYARAEALQRQSNDGRRARFGEAHPYVATGINALAFYVRSQGRYAEAEGLYRQALAMRREFLGNDHPDVATSLNGLSVALELQGRYDEAADAVDEVLRIRRRLYGNEHPGVATALGNLASILFSKGDFAGAEALDREALAIRRRLLGDRDWRVAQYLGNLASDVVEQGHFAEAEALRREALEIIVETLGASHPERAYHLSGLGLALYRQGRLAEAAEAYREAVRIGRDQLGNGHPILAAYLVGLGTTLRDAGDAEAAEPLLREALAIRGEKLGTGHVDYARSQAALGTLLAMNGHKNEAETRLASAVVTLREKLGDDHPDTRQAEQTLSRLRSGQAVR